MDRVAVVELHSIQPIANVPSIADRGILSHHGAAALPHTSVAAEDIQNMRADVVVPQGRRLHEYANLYFHARNPMMSRLRLLHEELCILRIDSAVLDLPEVVVTDGNASSSYTRFQATADGLDFIDEGLTFARDWRDPMTQVYWRKKRARCAEVRVPDRVTPDAILGAYVCGHGNGRARVQPFMNAVEVDADLFFC